MNAIAFNKRALTLFSLPKITKEGSELFSAQEDCLCRIRCTVIDCRVNSVSVSRKRLRKKLEKDRELQGEIGRVEKGLSIIKN